MKKTEKRNWSDYNRKLVRNGRLIFEISEEILRDWYYKGKRKQGGKKIYSDALIEAALIIKEYLGKALRQTQGFLQGLINRLNLNLKIPDYSTLSRRCQNLNPKLYRKIKEIQKDNTGLTIALDSTGLTVFSRTAWQCEKHGAGKRSSRDKWRKLHVAVCTDTGEILSAVYTHADVNDCEPVKLLLDDAHENIAAVCADLAYDTVDVRQEIYKRQAKQLIPPKKTAVISTDNRKIPYRLRPVLRERDEAIAYIKHNLVNGDAAPATANWKKNTGYHRRSIAETAMWRIKAHTSDRLTFRREDNRATQSIIKCSLLNRLLAE